MVQHELVAQLSARGIEVPLTHDVPELDAAALAHRLILSGNASERDALSVVASLQNSRLLDLKTHSPDPGLAPLVPAATAIALSMVPVKRMGSRLIVATSRADLGKEIKRALPDHNVMIALATRDDITAAIKDLYGHHLARQAECRTPEAVSARIWGSAGLSVRLLLPILAVAFLAVVAPSATYLGLVALALTVFAVNMGLKVSAASAAHRQRRADLPSTARAIPLFSEPVITLLVPIFDEDDVAGDILARIDRLDYPRDRLDVIFVLEEEDATTHAALRTCALPAWARAITVPPGSPQTKPRALNYALPFARGTIIGIYDAEDAPEPDQLRKVAARFAVAPPQVACLQGQLDYYNAGHNWISRSFTIEYATWFRLVLPGVAAMGLVVPLGGTTLFVKRDALISVGAWDAHNVTEDAELGIRLQRAGFRTELIDTTTFEEANSAIWPWIRQRSRWLKGYAITWATVMRRPGLLMRELGPRRFWGLQAQFAGTVLGFVTAPILWSFALLPFGLPQPVANFITPGTAGAIFACALLATLYINWLACSAPHLRRQRKFLPLMVLYYPLASIAAMVALIDLAARPFYWAKTAHGRYGEGVAD
ncbi:MAG: glycosyltransferase family 2 protein [Pseudomonadota bacterium]